MLDQDKLVIEKSPYEFARPWHRLFPPMLVVSITNVCNLQCSHCYYSKFKKRPEYYPNMMSWDIWVKICKEAAQWPGVIMNFGTDGEPLCHPGLLDMLRFAKEKGIYPINITTNGTLMEAAFVDAVIGEKLVDIINISLDAFTPETYRIIRGGDLTHLLQKLDYLITQRNTQQSRLKIQVNIIDQPDSRHELDDFRQYWGERVDNVLVRTYYDATSVIGETGRNITGRQIDFEPIDRWPCQQLWRRFNICDDGTVRFCVDDWFNKSKIGGLLEKSIHEIWTDPAYDKLRHFHICGEFDKVPYCSKCTEWQGMRWDYDYFVAMERILGESFLGT